MLVALPSIRNSERARRALAKVPQCWQAYVWGLQCELERGDYAAADAIVDRGLEVYRDRRELERLILIQWKRRIAQKRAESMQG